MTQVCLDCGKVISDLRRHKQRNRCYAKGPMSEKEKLKRMAGR